MLCECLTSAEVSSCAVKVSHLRVRQPRGLDVSASVAVYVNVDVAAAALRATLGGRPLRRGGRLELLPALLTLEPQLGVLGSLWLAMHCGAVRLAARGARSVSRGGHERVMSFLRHHSATPLRMLRRVVFAQSKASERLRSLAISTMLSPVSMRLGNCWTTEKVPASFSSLRM